MDKYIYDDKNGLWYELQGDYYIPYLTLPSCFSFVYSDVATYDAKAASYVCVN